MVSIAAESLFLYAKIFRKEPIKHLPYNGKHDSALLDIPQRKGVAHKFTLCDNSSHYIIMQRFSNLINN